MTTGAGATGIPSALPWREEETMTLTNQETATILHALRTLQCEGRFEGCAAGDCDHFEEVDALTNAEIDELCEKLNFD